MLPPNSQIKQEHELRQRRVARGRLIPTLSVVTVIFDGARRGEVILSFKTGGAGPSDILVFVFNQVFFKEKICCNAAQWIEALCRQRHLLSNPGAKSVRDGLGSSGPRPAKLARA